MSSGSDGWLPKYEVEGDDNGVLLQNYKKWLAAAQTALANGDSTEVGGMSIEAVPAYIVTPAKDKVATTAQTN